MVHDSKTKIKRQSKKEKKRKSSDDDDDDDHLERGKRFDFDNEKLRAITNELGTIHLSFPENPDATFEEQTNFPDSYCTLTAKEKLLLVFAENFRQQFYEKYPKRKPQILAIHNECRVQKFVSTTIRPTVLLYPELIQNWKAIAELVADYICYEPLENPIKMPNRLISPDTLLKRRTGNCFEMSTLLASLLIGAGFPAYVVSGYASREVTLNDQRRVICPFIPATKEVKEVEQVSAESQKYVLRDPPDFRSKFVLEQEAKRIAKEREVLDKIKEQNRKAIEEQEKLPPDEFRGWRLHAWVAIIIKVPIDSDRPETPDDDEDPEPEPEVFFIEPSTGFRRETNDPGYLGVEGVWNHYNYYVNRQPSITDVPNLKWRLSRTEDWEHLLPAEPYEDRIERPLPDDVEALTYEEELSKEKHLDMPISWVRELRIGSVDYEERFPSGEKIVHYKKAVYERFAPYKNKDGLMRRLTLFSSLNYEQPLLRWEWYQNRSDLLVEIKIDLVRKQIEETFIKGRPDTLKFFSHNTDENIEKRMEFFHQPRFDCLKELHFNREYIREFYEKRDDLLYFREFKMMPSKDEKLYSPESLLLILEKQIPSAIQDISIRTFFLKENRIFLKYHYGKDCITASTREFIKPPEPDYGKEIVFDPKTTWGYVSNPSDPQPSNLELYLLLLDQLKAEKKSISEFCSRVVELTELLESHKAQMSTPKLTFSIFDPLRNDGPRKIRLEKYEMIRAREEYLKSNPADFLSPYIVAALGRIDPAWSAKTDVKPKDREEDDEADENKEEDDYRLNREQSLAAFKNCLDDVRQHYLRMLNELQMRYDEVTTEANSLKRFLQKYQDQFNDVEYENLMKEGERVGQDKRIIQQRIINLHQEAERKYQDVRLALLNDRRLDLGDVNEL